MLGTVLLTITALAGPHAPASTAAGLTDAGDLGFLLHKHPDRHQVFDVTSGRAHVLYPEVSPERCTAALLLEVDPAALARLRGGRPDGAFSLGQFVNDRAYATSSLLAGAVHAVFRTAMAGRCDSRQHLADAPLDLEVRVPALTCRGGADLAQRLLAPLGWEVSAAPISLDPEQPAWGEAPYVDLRLRGALRLADALSHLYVLVPVLDDAKHHWVTTDEVDKLVRAGGGWLGDHPERALITSRYLKHQRSLVVDAATRLEEVDPVTGAPDAGAPEAPATDAPSPLRVLRQEAVLAALRAAGAATVADLGCGEGRLVAALLDDARFTRVLGLDVSARELDRAEKNLDLERRGDRERERVELLQGSAVHRDERLAGLDAIVLSEVVEHLDPERLPALVDAVLADARPRTVVITTPNVEHNACYVRDGGLAPGQLRHPDHRFEWTRRQMRDWAQRVGADHGYSAVFSGIGEDGPELGAPTQMAVLSRTDAAGSGVVA